MRQNHELLYQNSSICVNVLHFVFPKVYQICYIDHNVWRTVTSSSLVKAHTYHISIFIYTDIQSDLIIIFTYTRKLIAKLKYKQYTKCMYNS